MISSKFVLEILDLLLDGDEPGKALRPQIAHLTDAEYDYTGVGLFVTFQFAIGIERFRYKKDRVILEGVSITSDDLSNGASAIVFVSNGIITTLEIWSHDGEYPKRELSNYKLKQEGRWSDGRAISKGSDN